MAKRIQTLEQIAKPPPSGEGEILAVKKRRRKIKKLGERKSFRATLNELLLLEVPAHTLPEALKESPYGEKMNYRDAILLAQIIKAMHGDTQASNFVRDTSGNKLKEVEPQPEGWEIGFEDLSQDEVLKAICDEKTTKGDVGNEGRTDKN